MKTLMCWKSHFQTQLPTALFPTHYPGFADSFASGNFSPHTQLMFLTENWATVNIWYYQFCSPTKRGWPLSSDPNQCLLLICFTFYLTLIYICSHISRSFPSSIQRSLYFSCAECLQSQKLFLWVKCSSYVFADLLPCQKLSSLRRLSWSSLLPSPWDSPCSCLAPALGEVCQSWIDFQPSRQVDRSRGCSCRAMTSTAHSAGRWPEKLLVCV